MCGFLEKLMEGIQIQIQRKLAIFGTLWSGSMLRTTCPPPTGGANLLKGGGWLRGALPPFPPVDVDLDYMYNFTLKRKKMCFYLEK